MIIPLRTPRRLLAARRTSLSLMILLASASAHGSDPVSAPAAVTTPAATPADAAIQKRSAAETLARLLPPRSDALADWHAPLEPLHQCGEPRLLPTCVPPPPCHPALPPRPLDLVGMSGCPSCGPIYRGPCAPRTGTHDDGPHPRLHRVHDRWVDWFYSPRTPLHP